MNENKKTVDASSVIGISPRIRQHQDERGSLLALNFPELPFKCRRVFVVTDVPAGVSRGMHAHYETEQVLLCVSGRIEIKIDRIFSEESIVLTPGLTIFHRAMEWAEISYLEPNSVLLSACSTDFDPNDNINDYLEYRQLVLALDDERKKEIAAQEELLNESKEESTISMVDLKANYEAIRNEVDTAVKNVLDSAHYINGPDVRAFESKYAAFVGTKHCIGVSNGTDAILLCLKALDIGEGDEVIMQGNAFIADAMTVDSVNAKIAFVDHDHSFQLDLGLLEASITTKTKAVLVVHMYGSCCNMDRLVEICKRNKLKLIEDCAHAHGATWSGKPLGSFGDAAAWSFYPTKNLGAYGDGGAITTDSDELDDKVRSLKNYGFRQRNASCIKGLNSRLDSIHAAVLCVKLQYVQQWNCRRLEIARQYKQLLDGVGDITFPEVYDGCVPVYHQFVIITSQRDDLMGWLNGHKVNAMIHYPIPIFRQQSFECEYSAAASSLPRSSTTCDQILSLPMCPMMTDAMVMRVVAVVKSFYRHN